MRILIVARALPYHHIGGMEVVAWDLAQALAKTGATVTVITTPCPSLPAESVHQGIRVKALPGISGAYSARWSASLRGAWRSLSSQTDIVLSISAGAFPLLSERNGIPFVMQAHGTSWSEIVSKLAQRSPIAWVKAMRNIIGMAKDRAYRQFDEIVAVGPVVALDLSRLPTRLVKGPTPVTLIQNGIDTPSFAYSEALRSSVRARFGIAPEALAIVSSSRLHAQKGVAQSLAGMAELIVTRPDLRYLIVGDGPEASALRAEASRLGIGQACLFVGAVARPELRGLLSAADAFLFTSLRQEVGPTLSILEAMAAGLRCITSESQGLPESAILKAPARDPKAIAAAIEQALLAPRSARISLLPPELTIVESARRYLELFARLVNRRIYISNSYR